MIWEWGVIPVNQLSLQSSVSHLPETHQSNQLTITRLTNITSTASCDSNKGSYFAWPHLSKKKSGEIAPEGMTEVRKKSTGRDCSKNERGARCPVVKLGVKIFRRFFWICADSPCIVEAKGAHNEGECDNEENPEDVSCIVYHGFLQVANVVLVLVSEPDVYFMAFPYLIFSLFVCRFILMPQNCLLKSERIWDNIVLQQNFWENFVFGKVYLEYGMAYLISGCCLSYSHLNVWDCVLCIVYCVLGVFNQ